MLRLNCLAIFVLVERKYIRPVLILDEIPSLVGIDGQIHRTAFFADIEEGLVYGNIAE